MDDFKEILKDAICQENIAFLEENKDKYSMNDRFEDENNDSLPPSGFNVVLALGVI